MKNQDNTQREANEWRDNLPEEKQILYKSELGFVDPLSDNNKAYIYVKKNLSKTSGNSSGGEECKWIGDCNLNCLTVCHKQSLATPTASETVEEAAENYASKTYNKNDEDVRYASSPKDQHAMSRIDFTAGWNAHAQSTAQPSEKVLREWLEALEKEVVSAGYGSTISEYGRGWNAALNKQITSIKKQLGE